MFCGIIYSENGLHYRTQISAGGGRKVMVGKVYHSREKVLENPDS